MKKLALLLLLFAGMAAVGFTVWKKQAVTKATEDKAAANTVTVQRSSVRKTVQCTGSVVSNLDVEIKCKASGLVTKMPFDVSDVVKEGDLLVEIDPVDQLRNVQQAEATVAASKAKLALAKVNCEVAKTHVAAEKKRTHAVRQSASAKAKDSSAKAKRERDLLAQKQSSVEEAETAETTAIQAQEDVATAEAQIQATKAQEVELNAREQDINLAQAQLDSDLIALSLANQRLSETKVMAPMDGVVSVRSVQVGQIIASGINNIGGGTSVLTISDLSRMFVLASVDESDIGNVELDQKVDITADAYAGKHFEGKVVRIAAKGVSTSNVVTFEVRIEVLSENKRLLKPVMTTNIEILVAEAKDALTVPSRAITRRDQQTFVTVKNPETGLSQDVTIETGLSDGVNFQVVKGLNEGDLVVIKKDGADSRWQVKTTKTGGLFMPPRPRDSSKPSSAKGASK